MMHKYPKARYGQNSITNGNPYDSTRCAKEVWNGPRGMTSSQCSRKRGHGPMNLFCKQHAKGFEGER